MILLLIFFVGIFFFIIAFSVDEENADSLLAGYNLLNDKEKEGVNLTGLLNYLKKFYIFLSISITSIGLIFYFFTNEFIIIFYFISYIFLSHIYFAVKIKEFYTTELLKNNHTSLYLLIGIFIFTLDLLLIPCL